MFKHTLLIMAMASVSAVYAAEAEVKAGIDMSAQHSSEVKADSNDADKTRQHCRASRLATAVTAFCHGQSGTRRQLYREPPGYSVRVR